jgi:hypothetical protein
MSERQQRRAALRAQVFELDEGMCQWPGCLHRADELAHLHSIGAGGRKSADTPENCMAACSLHARMTDGLQPNGWPGFLQSHNALFGEGWEWRIPMSRWGYERAEALREHVARKRGTGVL